MNAFSCFCTQIGNRGQSDTNIARAPLKMNERSEWPRKFQVLGPACIRYRIENQNNWRQILL